MKEKSLFANSCKNRINVLENHFMQRNNLQTRKTLRYVDIWGNTGFFAPMAHVAGLTANMCASGKTFEDLLAHYFPGVFF